MPAVTHRRSPCGECGCVGERPLALDQEEAAGYPGPGHDEGRPGRAAGRRGRGRLGPGSRAGCGRCHGRGCRRGRSRAAPRGAAAVGCVRAGGRDTDEGMPIRPPGAGPREPFALQPVRGGRGVAAGRLPAVEAGARGRPDPAARKGRGLRGGQAGTLRGRGPLAETTHSPRRALHLPSRGFRELACWQQLPW
jgi:hypothetical protein